MQCDAVENKECCGVCDLPSPNPPITVGTQVRLTGVVEEVSVLGELEVRFNGGDMPTFLTTSEAREAEVIRQPFKRGEVVWGVQVGSDVAFQVLGSETPLGDVLLIRDANEGGHKSFVAHHSDFERRP